MDRWLDTARYDRLERAPLLLAFAAFLGACEPETTSSLGPMSDRATQQDHPQCLALAIPLNSTNVAKDGIPALSDPTFVGPDAPGAAYVNGKTRVVGIVVAGEPLAIPLNLLWWHDIVNLRRGSQDVAITYCPLTGSSISFDRAGIGGQELRVSGLLQDNNPVMFDKSDDESLWGQMSALGICGSARGRALPSVQSIETSFAEWRSMHPDTKVASSETGYDRNYSVNPYVDYWRTDAPPLFQTELPDGRLPPKQLVPAIPGGEVGGLAIPFNERAPWPERRSTSRSTTPTWWHSGTGRAERPRPISPTPIGPRTSMPREARSPSTRSC
jgi:hypothetical protein